MMTGYTIAGNIFDVVAVALDVEAGTAVVPVSGDPTGVLVTVPLGCTLLVLKLAVKVLVAYAVPAGGLVTMGAASPSPAETVG